MHQVDDDDAADATVNECFPEPVIDLLGITPSAEISGELKRHWVGFVIDWGQSPAQECE